MIIKSVIAYCDILFRWLTLFRSTAHTDHDVVDVRDSGISSLLCSLPSLFLLFVRAEAII